MLDIKEISHRIQAGQKTGEGADLRGADLRGADLSEASLCLADLRYAGLRRADLSEASLCLADLSGANLRYAGLRGADLREAKLIGADLSGANLRYADLRGADLSEADLGGANLRGTNVSRIIGHPWEITVYPSDLAIGCERHTIDDWKAFTDEEIEYMDYEALEWWKDWKDVILAYAKKAQGG